MFAYWRNYFEETHVFHRLITIFIFAAYLFAGAYAFQQVEAKNGAGCPEFTFWGSFFYVNTVVTSIGF